MQSDRSTMMVVLLLFFFFNDTATTEIYTLSLHDALPILARPEGPGQRLIDHHGAFARCTIPLGKCSSRPQRYTDRKSTRLNSSHDQISYAVFCLKKKKNTADS